MPHRRIFPWLLAALATAAGLSVLLVAGASAKSHSGKRENQKASARRHDGDSQRTTTPIKHLVVIFQENVSFDHYFGTYPRAANTDGQPFHAAPDTPTVNGLSKWLRTRNPNFGETPGTNGGSPTPNPALPANPQRLTPAEAATCDQDHGYTHEQNAFDHGIMDQFVQWTGKNLTLQQCLAAEGNPTTDSRPDNYAVMDYYDGNTVTGLWNYAQRFAMSDNSWSDGFGPSTPGALNVVSGNTYGALCGPSSAVYGSAPCPAAIPGTTGASPSNPGGAAAAQGTGTTYSDSDPYWDKCSYTEDQAPKPGSPPAYTGTKTIQMGGTNVGDLLNQAGLTWGWFQGGFEYPGYTPGQYDPSKASLDCTGTHKNILGQSQTDYSPHHQPFQYYASTANPEHLPPSSISMIGQQDQANHQYDLADFWAAADSGNMPAVSYLKAAEYQDGHAGYSDPLDEQTWLAETINHLESLPTWKSTMVVVLYDDSDGWYDHQMGPILNQSQTPLDSVSAPGQCGSNPNRVPTTDSGTPEQARCGVGQRQPLLVISPYSRQNFVDNHLSTQASVVKFVEDNWLGRQRIGNGSDDAWTGSLTHMLSFHGPGNDRLFLDPSTGEPTDHGHGRGH